MGKKAQKMGTIDQFQIKNFKYKIYILHGWTYEITKWEPFLNELKQYGVEGVMLKIPGLTAPLETPWKLDDYVNWLDKETKNDSKIAVLGHSNGGRIALSYVLKHPEKVDHLFLIDSAGIFHNEFLLRLKRGVFKKAAKIGKKITPEALKPLLYKMAREHDYERANPILQQTMKNLIATNLQPDLQKIKNPATIIWGQKDTITPFQDALTMHLLIKNSTLFPISLGRHSPQFTHHKEVGKIVSSVLKKA